MKKNLKLVEETKNTNYKLHKSKKSWLVSYSLVTFMLGGIYLDSHAGVPVKAAEIDSKTEQKKGINQDLQQSVDSKSIDNAKQNSSVDLDTAATTVKSKINSDTGLSSSDKSNQLKQVDAVLEQAKAEVEEASSLVDINATLTQAIDDINSCYHASAANTTVKKNKQNAKKAPIEKAPLVNKNKKPITKKVSVSTYEGLNSFFKKAETPAVATSEKAKAATESPKAQDSITAGAQVEETEKAGISSNSAETDTITSETEANDSAYQKNTNPDASQTVVTPRAGTVGQKDDDKSILLTSDTAEHSNYINTAATITEQNKKDIKNPSNHVSLPLQITNPDNFKTKVATVSTFEEFATAWADNKVSYINIVTDISNEQSKLELGKRSGRGSVVINGNGHRIDLGNAAFKFTPTTLPVQFALTNALLTKTASSDSESNLIDFKGSDWSDHDAPKASIYFDNVTAKSSDKANSSNEELCYITRVGKASVKFSGTNYFEVREGFTNQYGFSSVEFADNADVTIKTTNTKQSTLINTDVTSSSSVSIGNGASLTIYEDSDEASNKSVFRGVSALKAGNDVSWNQHGWGAFIDSDILGSEYFFGERFTLNHDILTPEIMPSIRLVNTFPGSLAPSVTFSKGASLTIKSNSELSPIFDLVSTASSSGVGNYDYDEAYISCPKLTINSPRALDISYCDEDGEPITPSVAMISTYRDPENHIGSFNINGVTQPLDFWTSNNVSTTPDKTVNGFDTFKIWKKTSTFDSAGNKTVDSSLFPLKYREMRLSNNDIPKVGSAVVQYVGQSGTVIKTVNMPLTDKDNFVGQRFRLLDTKYAVDEMPAGYFLARATSGDLFPGAVIDPDLMLTDVNGQAKYAYVPGRTATSAIKPDRIYTIYVWGTPQTVKFQYVDINHKDRGPIVPTSQTLWYDKKSTSANTGNVINWTSDRFKSYIPSGYHYYVEKSGENIQPKTTTVGVDNPIVTIYVEGDEKNINIGYRDTVTMYSLFPSNPVKITGRVGDTVTIPDAPDIPKYIFSRVTDTNASGSDVKSINIGLSNPVITYWYTNLDNIIGKYQDGITEAREKAKIEVNKNDTITQDEKTSYIRAIDNIYTKYIDKLKTAKTLDQCDQAVSDAKSEFQYIVDQTGLPLETQKKNAKARIDQALAEIKEVIDADKNLTSTEKADLWEKLSGPTAASAKNAIDAATNADKLSTALEKGVNDVQTYAPEFTLDKRKANAKAELSDKFKLIQPIKNTIDTDPTLSADEKAAQKAAIDRDVQQGTEEIGNAKNADEVVKLLEDWINTVKSEYKPGGNGSGSNGSDSNGSGSNGSDSNGSGSNGSDSNGSGSNSSDSNGSGSNGSDSNGSESNGSDSNGSGSNGSDSNGSESNGSGSNGSGSNGSESNGSGSNGSESNGSDSNGSGSNGSESNGSDSNGSGSNGSESNGSDSNGSGSNGSESNGSGSNGSSSNGSDSNGSESNGSGSNGSESNGSDSNGSESNGSGSNGSESNGSGSNGSDSNGSGSNGSGSNSSSNNSGNSGSGSNNSGSNNSSSAGTGSAGSGVNASGSNGSATSEGTSGETAGVDASKAVDKTLTHNAYFYDKNGNRANLLVAKKGSTISTFGTQKIGNRDFYLTDDGLYVAVNNFIGKKRTLKKNAFVYNKNGKRVGTKLLKKNAKVTTYGDPVSINGKSYFIIDNNRYVKAANFASAAKEANNVLADGVTSNATLGHDAYIYNGNGQRVNKVILKSGSQVTTGETKTVNGRQFVEIGKDQYLDSDNVTGTTRTLTSSAAVYNKYGKRVGSKTINKGENVQTFGSVVAIQGVAYYSIGNDEFVKQTAFE